MRALQHFANSLQHACKIRQYVMVPKTQDSISMRFEKLSSGVIRCDLFRVLPPVEFHNQSALQATKVGNERTNCMLAPELSLTQLSVTQLRPKLFLRVGNITSQLTSPRFLL